MGIFDRFKQTGRTSDEPERQGVFGQLRKGLQKTAKWLQTDIRDLFKSEGRLVDDEFLGELFARLIRTDMGVQSYAYAFAAQVDNGTGMPVSFVLRHTVACFQFSIKSAIPSFIILHRLTPPPVT